MTAPRPRPADRIIPMDPVRPSPWHIIASRPGEAAILLIIGAVIITAAIAALIIGG